jgi:hypothetical protein
VPSASLGLAVWCEDEAGPFQAAPHPGGGWRPRGHPATRPHERIRGGTRKLLTLFHPATGQVHLRPVSRCTNPVLHGWLEERPAAVVAALPARAEPIDAAAARAAWAVWRDGLAERFTSPERSPPPRLLLVRDNLTGHRSAAMVLWLCRHGIMPLHTPLGGGWLTMAEAIQRALERRALDGQRPHSPAEIGARSEQTARAWNRRPTPLLWSGKRRQRRRKRPDGRHAIAGSAAHTRQPLAAHRSRRQEWQVPRQVTH